MKPQKSIFRWFRRRPIPVAPPVIENKPKIEVHKTENQEKETLENTFDYSTPILDSSKKDNNSTHERELPKEKNYRDTIIKPKRQAVIEPVKEEDKKETENQKINIIKKKRTIAYNDETYKHQDEHIENKHDEIKEDKNKDANEIIIKTETLDEIERILKKDFYEAQNIQYELEVLEEKEKDEYLVEEIEKLIEELNQIIKRLEQIKKEFYQNNLEKIYNHSNSDGYIGQLIDEYKTSVKSNQLDENLLRNIKQIEEYIGLINTIIEIETKKDNIEQQLNDKKETLEIRDKEFDELKDKFVDVEKVNNYIESFSTEYNQIIKDIETKVANSTNITKKAEYKAELAVNYSRLITSTLLLAGSSSIPFTKGGNILKMGLMMAAVAGISSSIRVRTKETKVTTKISFIDYEKEILSNINSITDMTLMIDKTILDIKNIKTEFQKEFSEYVNVIPEYYEMISNLDSIEKDLQVKCNIMKEYDNKLGHTLEQNNVKVKRLEEEIPN